MTGSATTPPSGGAFALTRDERHQIGFRVAAAAEVERVTAVDWDWDDPRATGSDADSANPWEFMAAHQLALHQHIDQEGRRQIAEMQRILDAGTVRDLLHWLNTEEQEVANHRVYLGAVALAGDATDPVGVAWLAEWYRRNLTIFANLVRLAGSPGDRVLAIYGAGHVPLLRQFAQQSGLFHVVDAIAYL